MKLAIVEKLNEFLGTHIPFKEECEAVYLMVELRKLLDREEEGKKKRKRAEEGPFPLIRCYSDWTVHTAKDNITPSIVNVMNRINEFLNSNETAHPQNGNIDFLFLPELRNEMERFFSQYGLTTRLCTDEDAWKQFISVFVQVLADQPMKKPIPAISSFCFVPSNPGQILVNITFTDDRGSILLGFDDIS